MITDIKDLRCMQHETFKRRANRCGECRQKHCRCLHENIACSEEKIFVREDASCDLEAQVLPAEQMSRGNALLGKADIEGQQTDIQTHLLSMPSEDVAKMHAAHLDALGHLEKAVRALDVLETGGPLWERAKKLKDDVVASAKVLGKALYEHNKKTWDAVGNTRAGHAVSDAYKAATKQLRRASKSKENEQSVEGVDAQNRPKEAVQNEYMTNLPIVFC